MEAHRERLSPMYVYVRSSASMSPSTHMHAYSRHTEIRRDSWRRKQTDRRTIDRNTDRQTPLHPYKSDDIKILELHM